MYLKFWGVRGSLPTPLSPMQIRSKIAAVIQRITANDIKSVDAKERFLDSLPEWLTSTVGGNTACVQIRNSAGTDFILDAGTGIRLLGKKLASEKKTVYHIFLSHYHWDHIQGLPFFDPIYNPASEFHFYIPENCTYEVLKEQMEQPCFPVSLDSCTKQMTFHNIDTGVPFEIDGTKINSCRMSHPGNSYAYSFEENGRKIIYATDVELQNRDYSDDYENADFFKNADVLILDAQYTVEEAFVKENWGHSPFSRAIDFAAKWNVKNLFLFHHDPTYDDKKIDSILQSARWYLDYIERPDIKVFIAGENTDLTV